MRTLGAYRHYMGVLFRRGERWRLAVSVAGSIGIALLDTLSVLLVSPLIQAMGDSWRQGTAGTVARMLGLTTQTSLVASLLAMVIGGFVLKDLAAVAFNWWSLGFTASVRTRAQVEMTEYYMRLPYYHHAHLGLAVILRKTMVTVAQAYGAFANSVIGIFVQIFSVALMVTALLVSSPLITLTLLAFLGVAGVVFLRIIKPVNQRLGREQVELSEKSYGLAIDAFGAIKETQLRNSYEYFMRSMTGPIRRGAQIERVSGFVSALPKQTMEILFMLGLGVVFAVSAGDGVSSDMLATIALLVAAAFRLLPTVAGLMGSVANIRHAEAGTREYVESRLASLRPGAVPAPVSNEGVVPMALTSELVVDGVHFSYSPQGPEILTGINLRVPVGSTVAFVGSSGAGKSTLLDVIMGLQTPTRGRLLADGVDVSTNILGWQRNIGVVPQEVFLTGRTIAENVAFDEEMEDIDEQRVLRALKRADILDFVQDQPEGIWSRFGEGGRRLSGGQRQRVGIARALYREPRILVLDEATSALDNETEARIASTIAELGDDITVIIVAHRLSTVKDADMIAFLADGRVDAVGTFAELLDISEGFRTLAELGDLGQTVSAARQAAGQVAQGPAAQGAAKSPAAGGQVAERAAQGAAAGSAADGQAVSPVAVSPAPVQADAPSGAAPVDSDTVPATTQA